MGTAILSAQDCLPSYKASQNNHSNGRTFHQINLLQSGQELSHAKRHLKGRSPEMERRRTAPQPAPRSQDFERRKGNSHSAAFGNFSNGVLYSQGLRSGDKILRFQSSTPSKLDTNGAGESLSICYAQQSVLSRHYYQDAKYSLVNTIANHEVKGRKFSQQSKHIVMEEVTILKRGETLRSKEPEKKSQIGDKPQSGKSTVTITEIQPSNTKKNKSVWASKEVNSPGDEAKSNQAARTTDQNKIDSGFVITSTEPLGPDPSVLPKRGSGILQSISMGMKADTTIGNGSQVISKDSVSIDGVDCFHVGSPPSSSDRLSGSGSPVFGMENWAGPAYSHSPPPSSLPLPKFSMQQMRSIASDLNEASECPNNVGQAMNHGPVSHNNDKVHPSPVVKEKTKSVFTVSDRCANNSVQYGFDVSATQDLRRLLRLD